MNKISGHNFQYKIEDRVKASGWKTLSEQSYMDDVELKPREIDFVAFQEKESHNPRGNRLSIVVECKFMNNDINCYSRPNPKEEKAYFVDGYNKQNLFLDKSRFHFFSTNEVITNIIKDNGKKDTLGGAIKQSVKALLYLRGHKRLLDTKGLFFPIVVYGGTSKIFDQNSNELKNFLYYHSYEYKEPYSQNKIETRHIYVDVIHESNLEVYLDKIFKTEMNVLMEHILFNNKMRENKIRNRTNLAR